MLISVNHFGIHIPLKSYMNDHINEMYDLKIV